MVSWSQGWSGIHNVTKLALNSWYSCLYLPCIIIGMHCNTGRERNFTRSVNCSNCAVVCQSWMLWYSVKGRFVCETTIVSGDHVILCRIFWFWYSSGMLSSMFFMPKSHFRDPWVIEPDSNKYLLMVLRQAVHESCIKWGLLKLHLFVCLFECV